MIQELFNSINQTREILMHEIETLSFDCFNFIAKKNQWSIGQICHHLYLSEEYFIDSIIVAFESNNKEIEIKQIELVLDRSIKIESPEFAKPSYDPLTVKSVIENLHQSRKRLVMQINKIDDEETIMHKGHEHPLFGQLSIKQWLQLIIFHEIRHIEQIKELKEEIKNQFCK